VLPHKRYLIDRDVATTTGITASVPTMLALVEALGGRGKAQALATELGVDGARRTTARLSASRPSGRGLCAQQSRVLAP
jgi:transcriptional regulator GlxA family with amidase domain